MLKTNAFLHKFARKNVQDAFKFATVFPESVVDFTQYSSIAFVSFRTAKGKVLKKDVERNEKCLFTCYNTINQSNQSNQ